MRACVFLLSTTTTGRRARYMTCARRRRRRELSPSVPTYVTTSPESCKATRCRSAAVILAIGARSRWLVFISRPSIAACVCVCVFHLAAAFGAVLRVADALLSSIRHPKTFLCSAYKHKQPRNNHPLAKCIEFSCGFWHVGISATYHTSHLHMPMCVCV